MCGCGAQHHGEHQLLDNNGRSAVLAICTTTVLETFAFLVMARCLLSLVSLLPAYQSADTKCPAFVAHRHFLFADMQTFYHKNIVNQGAAVGTVESARSSTLLPPTLDLEWEHQYDVGSSEAAAAAEGEGRKTVSHSEKRMVP